MNDRMRFPWWGALAILLAWPALVAAFYGTVDPIPATIILDKAQTREPTDREIKITGISSEGYIEGRAASGKVKLLFKDVAKIEAKGAVYHVVARNGTTYDLTYSSIKTHYTSATLDCIRVNPDTGKTEELMLDPTQIKSIVFVAPTPAPAPSSEPDVLPPAAAQAVVDRKNPRAVAEKVLRAIGRGDGEELLSVCNETNKKKIKPADLPKALEELRRDIGDVTEVGELRSAPPFMAKGTVLAFLRTEGAETFVIVLTKDGDEYGFEDINSPDTADWEKLPRFE